MPSARDAMQYQENVRDVWIEMSASDSNPSNPTASTSNSGKTMLSYMASTFRGVGSDGEGVSPLSAASKPGGPTWHRSARFFFDCSVHIANLVLRVWALAIYYQMDALRTLVVQLVLEFIGAVLSIIVTCQDADVKLWLFIGPCWRRLLFAAFAVFGLGCCQLIHVKRAWARQLHVSEVLQKIDEQDFLWSGPALGAANTLPIALITGVPFALISFFTYLLLDHEHTESWVLGCATLSALCVVSLAVVELDTSVSAYVAKRYHFDPMQRGRRLGRFQCIYPIFHVLYRVVEVSMRVSLLMEFLVLMMADNVDRGKIIAGTGIFVDFMVGIALMMFFAPRNERICAHIVVGMGLLLANMVLFVDMPGFCRPARRISIAFESWRIVSLLAFFAFVLGEIELTGAGIRNLHDWRDTIFRNQVRLIHGAYVLLVTSAVHYMLRFSPIRWKMGDDLHTAVIHNRMHRVKKLLDAGQGGEMLDVNLRMKDAQQATPAMLAAQSGNVEALHLLAAAGARMGLQDSRGNTCLHYAVRSARTEAVAFLCSMRSCRTVLRLHIEDLRALAERSTRRLDAASRARMLDLLQLDSRRRLSSEFEPAVKLKYTSVKINTCVGRQLNKLFPDAVEEEIPPCTELISVSGLLLAYASGTLARCALRTEPREVDSGVKTDWALGMMSTELSQDKTISLASLRRVRKLGQGAAGAVIEVEVVEDSFFSSLGSFTPSKRRSHTALIADEFGLRTGFIPSGSSQSGGSSVPQRSRYAMKLQPKTQAHSQWQACSELLALQRAVHPFIVRLEQAFQTPQCFALLLELCPGGDMNKLLCTTQDDNGRLSGLPVDRCARYSGQVLLALVHVHENLGIIYRDVKPENILLSAADEAKLADFGLAVYVGTSKNKRLSVAGTAGFLAPELVYGTGEDDETNDQLNPFKTDAFSFGVTLEVMLLGEDCANIQVLDDSKWMLPRYSTEEESMASLRGHRDSGRLQREAWDLLSNLVRYRPSGRKRLQDDFVRRHDFFLNNLQFEALEMLLTPTDNAGSAGGARSA